MLTMAAVIPTTGFLIQRLRTRPVFVLAMTLVLVLAVMITMSGTLLRWAKHQGWW